MILKNIIILFSLFFLKNWKCPGWKAWKLLKKKEIRYFYIFKTSLTTQDRHSVTNRFVRHPTWDISHVYIVYASSSNGRRFIRKRSSHRCGMKCCPHASRLKEIGFSHATSRAFIPRLIPINPRCVAN
jgi:hypothetical protein